MNEHAGFDLPSLLDLFPPAPYFVNAEVVPGEDVPEPYRKLLVHEFHMTVTVEAHHGDAVDVEVLDHHLEGDAYSRKILLRLKRSRKCVLFGLVRIHLHFCAPEVRERILSRTTPLGRILIEHNVMRRIEPTAFLRITPGAELMRHFGLTSAGETFGRLALIHCDGQPAIELLEIVSPEEPRKA